jgi:pyridoxal phosphate enzyme (YggS family)
MTTGMNADAVRARIAAACARAGRAEASVTLVAVAKTKPAEVVREAFAAGLSAIGENYVQELTAKQAALADLPIAWHYIGRLQRNKAKDVAGKVALIHTVDSLALAEALDRRAAAPQDVLVQVNLAGEEQKGGVGEAELPALLDGIAALAKVKCRGLMIIPPAEGDNRRHFRALAELARKHALPELSMGMSDDFEVAIEEGATIVRVGSAIFGARPLS